MFLKKRLTLNLRKHIYYIFKCRNVLMRKFLSLNEPRKVFELQVIMFRSRRVNVVFGY